METLVQDVRFALRSMLKTPVITSVALLSLALGIGANTTIFTLLNAFFLQRLAVAEPDQLVRVYTTDERNAAAIGGPNELPISFPNYEDFRDRNQVFSNLAGYQFVGVNFVAPGGEAQQLQGLIASANYFDALGVRPVVGRFFAPEEDRTPQAVAVLSFDLWQQRFGGDPAAIGKVIQLNGHPFTVIGVAPAKFQGVDTITNCAFWVPLSMNQVALPGMLRGWFENRRALLLLVFGRLREGVGVEAARSAVGQIAEELREEYPVPNQDRGADIKPLAATTLPPGLRESTSTAGWLLASVVGLVLLIACANVANLLLARSAARQREIAVRLSLGATAQRLVRQLLTESVVLALVGGLLGLLLAYWGRNALWSLRPPFLDATLLDLSLNGRVFLFALGLSLITGLVFGLVPALQAAKSSTVSGLKKEGEGAEKAQRGFNLREALVVLQVALSLVALAGSGLFLRSLLQANQVSPGFEVDHVAVTGVDVSTMGYDPARGEQFFDQVLELAKALPGVDSVALSTNVPFAQPGFMRSTLAQGQDPAEYGNGVLVPTNVVSPDYFRTLSVPLLQGRDFGSEDRPDTVPVAIVNRAAVHQFWPELVAEGSGGVDPGVLGRWVQFYGEPFNREVVGVVEDTKQNSVGEPPQPQIYLPRKQNYRDFLSLFVRTSGDPSAALGTVVREVKQLDPQLALPGGQTLSQVLTASLWAPRMGAILLGVFGVLALVLACIGIYGVMANSVQQRSREIGIRMALGAQRRDVLSMVLRRGMLLVGIGLGAGLVLAQVVILATDRFLTGLLFGIRPTDVTTFAGTMAILALVALLANLVPARRATRVNPIRVLRYE